MQILLSVKNDQANTNNGGDGPMEPLIINDDSSVERASMGKDTFGSISHNDTPLVKAPKLSSFLPEKEGTGGDKEGTIM